jgi:hypothetical protein
MNKLLKEFSLVDLTRREVGTTCISAQPGVIVIAVIPPYLKTINA